jgi:RNase P subunit RPR2
MTGIVELWSRLPIRGPRKMERKCGTCGTHLEPLRYTMANHNGLPMPAEILLCPRCESIRIYVVDPNLSDMITIDEDLTFNAGREGFKENRNIIEVMCPRCGVGMFFVQHVGVGFGDVDPAAESWTCECGTTVQIVLERRDT